MNNIFDLVPISSQCPNLSKLLLHHNSLTSIDSLAKCQKLEYLDVSHNHITDFVGLAPLSSLKTLNISHNCIQDPMSIRAMSHLTSLQALSIDENPFFHADDDLWMQSFLVQVRNTSPSVKYLNGFHCSCFYHLGENLVQISVSLNQRLRQMRESSKQKSEDDVLSWNQTLSPMRSSFSPPRNSPPYTMKKQFSQSVRFVPPKVPTEKRIHSVNSVSTPVRPSDTIPLSFTPLSTPLTLTRPSFVFQSTLTPSRTISSRPLLNDAFHTLHPPLQFSQTVSSVNASQQPPANKSQTFHPSPSKAESPVSQSASDSQPGPLPSSTPLTRSVKRATKSKKKKKKPEKAEISDYDHSLRNEQDEDTVLQESSNDDVSFHKMSVDQLLESTLQAVDVGEKDDVFVQGAHLIPLSNQDTLAALSSLSVLSRSNEILAAKIISLRSRCEEELATNQALHEELGESSSEDEETEAKLKSAESAAEVEESWKDLLEEVNALFTSPTGSVRDSPPPHSLSHSSSDRSEQQTAPQTSPHPTRPRKRRRTKSVVPPLLQNTFRTDWNALLFDLPGTSAPQLAPLVDYSVSDEEKAIERAYIRYSEFEIPPHLRPVSVITLPANQQVDAIRRLLLFSKRWKEKHDQDDISEDSNYASLNLSQIKSKIETRPTIDERGREMEKRVQRRIQNYLNLSTSITGDGHMFQSFIAGSTAVTSAFAYLWEGVKEQTTVLEGFELSIPSDLLEEYEETKECFRWMAIEQIVIGLKSSELQRMNGELRRKIQSKKFEEYAKLQEERRKTEQARREEKFEELRRDEECTHVPEVNKSKRYGHVKSRLHSLTVATSAAKREELQEKLIKDENEEWEQKQKSIRRPLFRRKPKQTVKPKPKSVIHQHDTEHPSVQSDSDASCPTPNVEVVQASEHLHPSHPHSRQLSNALTTPPPHSPEPKMDGTPPHSPISQVLSTPDSLRAFPSIETSEDSTPQQTSAIHTPGEVFNPSVPATPELYGMGIRELHNSSKKQLNILSVLDFEEEDST
ncbi:hypothetical protein BLNAU_10837 [Blattamonas nauphoetae]|uniref:Uncharacterized protein n=1 Tax=Blattamonas nauphoetae TaxID=2049346 RepID=A0ABQ9XRP5_9EUKA|nr:hypothetical protein BLNAU_10837 [Blattamonas nauphoetae]